MNRTPIETLAASAGILGLADSQERQLEAELDPSRIRKRQGLDYLAAHDCVRVANRIFGYGRWGHRVVELVEVAAVQVKKDNREGWHVGYRCTVELTVAGCVPVSGVGYGDGVEYTPAARVRACELAIKEAESDALKRALKNYGDQFGLILYAKEDEKRRIEAEKHQAEAVAQSEAAKATDEEVEQVKQMASSVSAEVRAKTDAAIKAHRDKNETERGLGPVVDRGWLAKLADGIAKQAEQVAVAKAEDVRKADEEIPFTVPVDVATSVVTETAPDGPNVGDAFAA